MIIHFGHYFGFYTVQLHLIFNTLTMLIGANLPRCLMSSSTESILLKEEGFRLVITAMRTLGNYLQLCLESPTDAYSVVCDALNEDIPSKAGDWISLVPRVT